MYIYKAPNVNGSVISVGTTSTKIFDAINTAASTNLANAGYPTQANSIHLRPENGDIRYTLDGSTPTATKGFLLPQGSFLMLAGIPLTALRMISVSSSAVSCSVMIGRISTESEAQAISSGGSGGANSNAVSIGGVNYPVKDAVINASTSGNNTLVAAVTGKSIRVMNLHLILAGAVTFTIQSGAGGTALTGAESPGANGGLVLNWSPAGHFQTASNALLNLNLSSAVQVSGSLNYIEI